MTCQEWLMVPIVKDVNVGTSWHPSFRLTPTLPGGDRPMKCFTILKQLRDRRFARSEKLKVTLPLSVRRQGSTGEFCLDPVRNAIIAQGELRPIVHVEGR